MYMVIAILVFIFLTLFRKVRNGVRIANPTSSKSASARKLSHSYCAPQRLPFLHILIGSEQAHRCQTVGVADNGGLLTEQAEQFLHSHMQTQQSGTITPRPFLYTGDDSNDLLFIFAVLAEQIVVGHTRDFFSNPGKSSDFLRL